MLLLTACLIAKNNKGYLLLLQIDSCGLETVILTLLPVTAIMSPLPLVVNSSHMVHPDLNPYHIR